MNQHPSIHSFCLIIGFVFIITLIYKFYKLFICYLIHLTSWSIWQLSMESKNKKHLISNLSLIYDFLNLGLLKTNDSLTTIWISLQLNIIPNNKSPLPLGQGHSSSIQLTMIKIDDYFLISTIHRPIKSFKFKIDI